MAQPEYERLAEISVSHLYNLRRSVSYRRQRVQVHHTIRDAQAGRSRRPQLINAATGDAWLANGADRR